MSPQEAYNVIIKKYPGNKVRDCFDFETFYLFNLVPINIPDNQTYLVGKIFDVVDKKTGKISKYDITSDINAYERAKRVEIKETIFDKKIRG